MFHTFSVNSCRSCQILMTNFSFIFDRICVPGSSFSDEITIMVRHYVMHLHLKIRHYVIHPTNYYRCLFRGWHFGLCGQAIDMKQQLWQEWYSIISSQKHETNYKDGKAVSYLSYLPHNSLRNCCMYAGMVCCNSINKSVYDHIGQGLRRI